MWWRSWLNIWADLAGRAAKGRHASRIPGPKRGTERKTRTGDNSDTRVARCTRENKLPPAAKYGMK